MSVAEDVCQVKVKIVSRRHELERNLHRHPLFEVMSVSIRLTVNRQMTKNVTMNRGKRNIFTVNRQMSKTILAVTCLRYPLLKT